MISKETYDKIQWYKDVGFSIHKATNKLGISYNTTYKWWNKSEEEFMAFQKEHEFVLDNYRQYIIEQLKICPQINNTLILRRLYEDFSDFEIPAATFQRYMKRLREQTGLQKPKRSGAIRNVVAPGYEGQVDFGQYTMKSMYGNNIRVYFLCMVLSYSRMKFAYFSNQPFDAKKAIEAHKYAFKYFGGRPQMLVYDQDRVIVVSENMGDVIFVKEFEEYIKNDRQNIVIVGDCATGKTSLAVRIAKQAIEKGAEAVYTTEEDLIVAIRRQKTHWNKLLHSDLIVLDELFYLKPSEENLQLLYKTVMFLQETRSIIFVTNRALSEWDNMGVDKHTVSTFRKRIMVDAQLVHLG